MVEPDTWTLSLSRYIHLNQVRVKRFGLDKVRSGRELALHSGREVCGLTLSQLQAAVEAGTAMRVSSAVRPFGERLGKEKPLRKALQDAMKELESATKCATNV